ncbi:MAG: hypothetical protein WCH61_04185 [bacterium]
MSRFETERLARAAAGELAALAELDALGLFLAPGEVPTAFVASVRALDARLQEFEAELVAAGRCDLGEGVRLDADRRIPPERFADAWEITERRFAFRADWAPGFYVDPTFSWLFGGCAFTFDPERFAVFIIREVFARRDRWLIYGRDELLAHEACHVARMPLASERFEERHAYGTAATAFRRRCGSLFRKPSDSLLFLGVTMLLLAAQSAQLLLIPRLPMFPFWGAVGAAVLFLGVRDAHDARAFARARRVLATRFGDFADAVRFRCSDAEIAALARLAPAALEAWLEAKTAEDWRWRVIRHRFMAPEAPAPGTDI